MSKSTTRNDIGLRPRTPREVEIGYVSPPDNSFIYISVSDTLGFDSTYPYDPANLSLFDNIGTLTDTNGEIITDTNGETITYV